MFKRFIRNIAKRLRCVCVSQCCVTVTDSDDNLEVYVSERSSSYQSSSNTTSNNVSQLATPTSGSTLINQPLYGSSYAYFDQNHRDQPQQLLSNIPEQKQFILKLPAKTVPNQRETL